MTVYIDFLFFLRHLNTFQSILYLFRGFLSLETSWVSAASSDHLSQTETVRLPTSGGLHLEHGRLAAGSTLSVLSEPSLIQAGHCPRATFACPRSGVLCLPVAGSCTQHQLLKGSVAQQGILKELLLCMLNLRLRSQEAACSDFFSSSVFSGLMWIYMAGCWEPPLGTKTTLTGSWLITASE